MRIRFALLAIMIASLPGCMHSPKPLPTEPIYYLDNSLPFQPKRLWRLIVRWDPYLLDDKKALVKKEFQLLIHDGTERSRLETEILARGGDANYLNWFENELVPLGYWDVRDQAQIVRYRDYTAVTLTTKPLKEVTKTGFLKVDPVFFPDPLFRIMREGCAPLNWEAFTTADSVGWEVVLESRDLEPEAVKWERVEGTNSVLDWRMWSVGQGRRIAYRIALIIRGEGARCPLPPEVFSAYERIRKLQPMGIQW